MYEIEIRLESVLKMDSNK